MNNNNRSGYFTYEMYLNIYKVQIMTAGRLVVLLETGRAKVMTECHRLIQVKSKQP